MLDVKAQYVIPVFRRKRKRWERLAADYRPTWWTQQIHSASLMIRHCFLFFSSFLRSSSWVCNVFAAKKWGPKFSTPAPIHVNIAWCGLVIPAFKREIGGPGGSQASRISELEFEWESLPWSKVGEQLERTTSNGLYVCVYRVLCSQLTR